MSRERSVWTGTLVALATALCASIATPAAAAGATPARKAVGYAKVARACPAPGPASASCFALVRVPVSSTEAAHAGVKPYAVGDGASESGPAGGLTPAQLARAYGYEASAGGSGQTIGIVDAYDDPNIESDLEKFDSNYGIAACTEANGCFTKVSQTGSTTALPEKDRTGWSVEISLDVEAAHSTCPQCKIVLVEANNALYNNLATAVDEAVSLKADEVSNSYGGPEEEPDAAERAAYDHPGVVIAAATGDDGWEDWTEAKRRKGAVPPALPNMPASFPSVVAVGGTTLELGGGGKRERESVWNGNGPEDSSEYAEGATGGGCSTLFTAQPWQQHAPGFAATGCAGKRLAADVSADANPYTGFDIYDSYNCGKTCQEFKGGKDWLTVGGTSLATPLISAMYALAGGSEGVAYPALTLYGHLGQSSSLFDVTEGGSGYCDDGGLACGINARRSLVLDCEGTTACNAGPGYDGPSGVGAPNGLSLFKPLLPTAAIAAPASLAAGASASFSGTGSSDPYPGGSISGYAWSWGDGTPDSSGPSPSHTYAAPGQYTVTLTVTDSYGLTSAPVTRSVVVPELTLAEREEQAAKHEAEEAAGKQAEEEASTKRRQEAERERQREEEAVKSAEQAAAAAKKQEEEAAGSLTGDGSQLVSGFHASLAPPVPDARLAGTSLRASRSGAVTLKVSCPAAASRCSGTVTLRTLGARALTLAAGTFSVPAGKADAVIVHMTAKARAALSRSRTLRIRVTLLAHDPQGASHTTRALATLREPT